MIIVLEQRLLAEEELLRGYNYWRTLSEPFPQRGENA